MGEKNNMIPDEQLNEWKEAEQYLTPSPWHYDSNNKLSDSNHKSLIDRDGYFKKFNDAEFCSRARKYFPLLIQAYEEQKAELKNIGLKLVTLNFQTAKEQELANDIIEQTLTRREQSLKILLEEQKKEIEKLLNIIVKELEEKAEALKRENCELKDQRDKIQEQQKQIDQLNLTIELVKKYRL